MNFNCDFVVLNVYMVRDIILNVNNIGNVFGFYFNDCDWVVMLNNEVRSLFIILMYELGYFFSFFYLFNGWESDFYDLDRYGNLV